MGKLTFKGDKKKKTKKVANTTVSRQDPILPEKASAAIEGWSSATVCGDLKGPCIFLHGQSPPLALQYDSMTDSFLGLDNTDILSSKDCTNFFESDLLEYLEIDRVEPNSTSQVFSIIPINDSNKSLLSASATEKFAFKHRDSYLSYNSNGTLELVPAISKNEIFTLEPHQIPNGVFWYIIASNGHKLTYTNSTYSFHHEEGTAFVIRVHINNTIKGSQLILESSQPTDSNTDVKKAIRTLYKETNGKIIINNDLVNRLKTASQRRELNEAIINEKSKYLSKW